MTTNRKQTLGNNGRPSNQARRAQKLKRKNKTFLLEKLEERTQPAGDIASFDGTGNNLLNTEWGSTDSDYLRKAPAAYADGISTPGGTNRPSARVISNTVNDHPDEAVLNDRFMSNFVYAWGQFIDHDMDLTMSASPSEAFNIAVPQGDPEFDPTGTGTKTMSLSRSQYDPLTGTSTANPRQQFNSITAFLDGSMVYGSSDTVAASLRTFSGGKLKTSGNNLLPTESANSPMFLAGDIRANENPELTSLHVLFLREHNRVADKIAKDNPSLTDEQIYQRARKVVIAEIQVITYKEFLPALMGANPIAPYAGYNAKVNPGISNEFATAAFRLGHSMLGDDIEFLDNNGNEVRDAVGLRDAFFNPDLLRETGPDPLLKYLASDNAEEIDTKVVDSLRNFLFGPPGAGGLDLASLNIQRGRDHGLADYNSTRAAFGLPKVKSFADITPDKQLQDQLKSLYGDVNNIDLWVGGLAEKHLPGSSLGPTFQRILADQFTRLRDGDRFWYQRQFSGPQLADIERTSLADVIRRNTGVTNIQDNVFVFRTEISGRVFADLNRDGKPAPVEKGIGGRVMELVDSTGATVASTKTAPDGSYRFVGIDLGTYTVRDVTPAGVNITTPAVKPIAITRGMTVGKVDFGEAVASSLPTQTTGGSSSTSSTGNNSTNGGGANTNPGSSNTTQPTPRQQPASGMNPAAVDSVLTANRQNSSPRGLHHDLLIDVLMERM